MAHSTVDRPDSSDRQRNVTPSFLPSPLVLCLVFQTVQFSTSQSVRSIKNKHLTEAGDNSLALPGLPGELLTLSEVEQHRTPGVVWPVFLNMGSHGIVLGVQLTLGYGKILNFSVIASAWLSTFALLAQLNSLKTQALLFFLLKSSLLWKEVCFLSRVEINWLPYILSFWLILWSHHYFVQGKKDVQADSLTFEDHVTRETPSLK